MKLQVNSASRSVTLHAVEIEIFSATIVSGDRELHGTVTYSKEDETAVLTFDEEFGVGAASLGLTFKGELNDKMAGFYRSKYFVNGQERFSATTQMEPTDARRAFPCWDEPALKATFNITLVVPKLLRALSNMPVESVLLDGENKIVAFGATPVMSTYLVAFVIGEYDFVEGATKEGVQVRVYTPLGRKELGVFALDVAVRTLSYFSEYFDISYPLPKSDMIAIDDFSAGAMENWGLITYRSAALLIDPHKSSAAQRQRVAYVVAHELAHQWFGNLVTMEWWDDLWLNEGFATFIGTQACDQLFPEWQVWTQFVNQYFSSAMKLDCLKNSHPIQVEVNRSSQVDEIFDAISYNKGSCVIRMIANIVGAENFRDGLRVYLKRHAYKNTTTQDLWRALSETSNINVGEFMSPWTRQTGFPYIVAEQHGDKLRVRQQRFLVSGEEELESQWPVFLRVRHADGSQQEHVLRERETEIALPHSHSDHAWLKLNPGQSGFFRVLYDHKLLKQLSAALESNALDAVDRLGIQDDTYFLVKSRNVEPQRLLEVLDLYRNETDYTVWSNISSNLSDLATLWSGQHTEGKLSHWIRSLFSNIGAKLGWDAKPGESDLNALLRSVVLSKLASNGDEATIAEAKKRFDAFLVSEANLAVDLRGTVFAAIGRFGSDEQYDALLNAFTKVEMQEEKIRVLLGLSVTSDAKRLEKILNYAVLSGNVRNQDIYIVFFGTSSSAAGRQASWDFLRKHWSVFREKFGEGASLLSRIIGYTTENFTSLEKATEVEAFFAQNPVVGAERTINQSLEKIRINSAWLHAAAEPLGKWLEHHVK